MRILVTNDDGVNAEGLWPLVRALHDVGEVCVVAPDRDKSGVGTGMTLLDVVRVHDYSSPVDGVEAYSVEGTPSDCVILATQSLFTAPFDLVVSGINAGANIGLDVLSSGTVGAALQGFCLNIPSIAVSAVYSDTTEVRYAAAARAAQALASGLSEAATSEPLLLNVNLPDVEPEGIQGVEVTQTGALGYRPNVERRQVGRRTHYWIRYKLPESPAPSEGSDIWAIRRGRVSITPMDLGLHSSVPAQLIQALADRVRVALGLGDTDTAA